MKALWIALLILFVSGCKSDVGVDVNSTPADTWKLSVWSRVMNRTWYLTAEVMPDTSAGSDSIKIQIGSNVFTMKVDTSSGSILISHFQPPPAVVGGLPRPEVPHVAWTK